MNIGQLVTLKRNGRFLLIFRIADNGNIGLWPLDGLSLSGRRALDPNHLIWTHTGALEIVS